MDALEELRERIIGIINSLPLNGDELKQVVALELRDVPLKNNHTLTTLSALIVNTLHSASTPDEGLDAIADVWDTDIVPLMQHAHKEAA